MTTKHRLPYSYSILRYVHDVATGEFLNVGVVVTSPEAPFVRAKFKSTFGRIKGAFPTVDSEVFKARMRKLQTAFDQIGSGEIGRSWSKEELKIENVVHLVLRQDDSSLQWSPPGSGLSSSAADALNSLFARFVTKFDVEVQSERRKDDDVWREFRYELEKRNVLFHLEEKVIEVADDSIKFQHAWKNGAWHCYEPLSFDLASDSSIREKAHRWVGHMLSVQEAKEDFQVYFLVGKPESSKLQGAYEKAISILKKAPGGSVVEEADASAFSEQVAQEIASHQRAALD